MGKHCGAINLEPFTVFFDSKAQLSEVWQKNLAQGMCFIPTPKVFDLSTELALCLQVQRQNVGVKIPTRVIQVLPPADSNEQGIVLEFLNFDQYHKELNELLRNYAATPWNEIFDFTQSNPLRQASNSAKTPQARAVSLEAKKIVETLDGKDYYDCLKVDRSASFKEIREAFFSLSKILHPDHLGSDVTVEDRQMIEAAYQKIARIYEVLKDTAKRNGYDVAIAKIIRRRGEAEKAFVFRKMSLLQKKMDKKMGNTKKQAANIFQEALLAADSGDYKAAITSIKIALKLDPSNREFRKKLTQLEENSH